jgi:hypothetical protein
MCGIVFANVDSFHKYTFPLCDTAFLDINFTLNKNCVHLVTLNVIELYHTLKWRSERTFSFSSLSKMYFCFPPDASSCCPLLLASSPQTHFLNRRFVEQEAFSQSSIIFGVMLVISTCHPSSQNRMSPSRLIGNNTTPSNLPLTV